MWSGFHSVTKHGKKRKRQREETYKSRSKIRWSTPTPFLLHPHLLAKAQRNMRFVTLIWSWSDSWLKLKLLSCGIRLTISSTRLSTSHCDWSWQTSDIQLSRCRWSSSQGTSSRTAGILALPGSLLAVWVIKSRRHVAYKAHFLRNGHHRPLKLDANVLYSTCGRDLIFADKDCCSVVFQNNQWGLIVSNFEHNHPQPQ